MPISKGDTLPNATLALPGETPPKTVDVTEWTKGRKVAIFGMPGAFTGTCSGAHMPSVIETKDALIAKGVDEIAVLVVNDPFVTDAWAKETGAEAAGITLLCDLDGAFSKAIGMDLTVPPLGFFDRSKRYAMVAEDGVVTVLNEEESPGSIEASGGTALLAAL